MGPRLSRRFQNFQKRSPLETIMWRWPWDPAVMLSIQGCEAPRDSKKYYCRRINRIGEPPAGYTKTGSNKLKICGLGPRPLVSRPETWLKSRYMLQALHFTEAYILILAIAQKAGTKAAATSSAAAPSPKGDAGEDPTMKQWVWCVEDDEEKPICDKMNKVLSQIDPAKDHTHTCIISDNGAEGCMKAIRDGSARFGVFDGGEIWTANQQYGLIPIRKQSSDYEPDVYWGVGVVKADKCPDKLEDLKGKVSCHTGYGRSAGWVLPISYLLQNNIMPVVSQDPTVPNDIESVEHFFSKSCAANDNPKKEICSACKKTVDCNMDDQYYDYDGAFRCLVEGSGDVAFTKHDIPTLYASGGLLDAHWNNLGHASDYKILCPGRELLCHDTGDYKECNFGEAPGHTIMVSSNFSQAEIGLFNKLMNEAATNESYTSIFGNETVGNEFAAGVSRSVAYNGSVVGLLGPLYKRTLYLQSINSHTATNDISHAHMFITHCTSFGLTVFLPLSLLLVFTVFI